MSDSREILEAVRIPAAHPSLPGHFPGEPVVPGVVLLDRIAAAIERESHARLARIATVKFLAPLRPDEDARLHVVVDGARVRFRIARGETQVLAGEGGLA